LRIAVITPFVDRQHGSERAVAELLDRLRRVDGNELHLFAERVTGVEVGKPEGSSAGHGEILWHQVPGRRGPHLLAFWAWYRRNQQMRRGTEFDIVFSPGVNCPDADIILVHALFSRLRELAATRSAPLESELGLARRLHRLAYYRLASGLESRAYRNPQITLATVSQRTASLLAKHYGRSNVHVVPNGVDPHQFSPATRLQMRTAARWHWGFRSGELVLLLIGNDWQNKGLATVLEALGLLDSLPLRLLVVGEDAPEPFQRLAEKLGVAGRCVWERPRPDALELYAASDVYVSPSREDSFALPVLEAMACGLVAITSGCAGVSELLRPGQDAFVLGEPSDAKALATLVRRLHESPELRGSVGKQAVQTAARWSWDRHVETLWSLFRQIHALKVRAGS
jgi:glycosyltransferase involved in cell wall biosynthesis